jgi:WD40 repeat protein
MIRNNFLLHIPVVILAFILAACGESLSTGTTLTPDMPSPTPKIVEPHPTSTPRLIPQPSESPIFTPANATVVRPIDPANAGQVIELAKLGKGMILSPVFAFDSMQVYSPDGLWLAVPTLAGIYIYDAFTLEELRQIPVGTSFVFSPQGGILAAGGQGAVSLWDPATGARTGELGGDPEHYYYALAFSSDGSLLSILSWNREIAVWSLESKQIRFIFDGDWLQFSPDGELAAVVVYGENRVHLYETRGGTEVNQWNARHAGFTPGGQLWLEDDHSVRLVDVERDLVTAPFSGVQPSFSADGTLMALFANGQISLYDLEKGRRAQTLEGIYAQIDGVLFSPDGQTLAGNVYTLRCPACSEMDGLDRSRILWKATDGSIITQMGNPEPPGWMAYSTDGSSLAVIETENVHIINTADGSLIKSIDGYTNPVEGMALSPDGRKLAAAHAMQEYTLRLWDLETGRVVRTLQNQEGASLMNVEVAYSPNEKYIAVGGDVWDLESGQRLTRMEQVIGDKTSCWPSSVAFSSQGGILATGCFGGQLDLWSVPDGSLLNSLEVGYDSWVNGLAYSPNGEHIAAIYSVPDYLVQIWGLPEGKASIVLTGGHFTRVAYSPDGETLATVAAINEHEQFGGPAGVVQLWSALDGEELTRLEIDDAVSIAFSPDSRILATGSLDGTLRLWELAGGSLLKEASGHYAQIQRLAFTPDGTTLLSGSRDGTIMMWGIPTAP